MYKGTLATTRARTDWAEDDEDDNAPSGLPAPQTIKNKDGSETTISYHTDEISKKKVKTTRRIRRVTVKISINPNVAERGKWKKFGLEENSPAGPQPDSTSVDKNIIFKPVINWRAAQQKEETSAMEQAKRAATKDNSIKCRICFKEHFTSKCPFKGTEADPGFGNNGDEVSTPTAGGDSLGGGAGALGTSGSSYVPPHLRGKTVTGERMGGSGGGGGSGRYGADRDRDDVATVRVSNIGEYAEEDELRALFSRCGTVTRVFIARDRVTDRTKGFAYVSFTDRVYAEKAMQLETKHQNVYNNLVFTVDWAKKST